jgi:hypothetical protein
LLARERSRLPASKNVMLLLLGVCGFCTWRNEGENGGSRISNRVVVCAQEVSVQ